MAPKGGGQQTVVEGLKSTFTEIASLMMLPDSQQHMQFLTGLLATLQKYVITQGMQAAGQPMPGAGPPGPGGPGQIPGGQPPAPSGAGNPMRAPGPGPAGADAARMIAMQAAQNGGGNA